MALLDPAVPSNVVDAEFSDLDHFIGHVRSIPSNIPTGFGGTPKVSEAFGGGKLISWSYATFTGKGRSIVARLEFVLGEVLGGFIVESMVCNEGVRLGKEF